MSRIINEVNEYKSNAQIKISFDDRYHINAFSTKQFDRLSEQVISDNHPTHLLVDYCPLTLHVNTNNNVQNYQLKLGNKIDYGDTFRIEDAVENTDYDYGISQYGEQKLGQTDCILDTIGRWGGATLLKSKTSN